MAASASPSEPKVGVTVHLLGTLITLKATAAETDGSFSLVEVTTAPGQGTPAHLHREDAEAFYVLEGTYDFTIGDMAFRSGSGSFHYAPHGTPHSFQNSAEVPARMLIINLPGGVHERFFMEAGEPVADAAAFPPITPLNVPRLIEVCERYGIEMLPKA